MFQRAQLVNGQPLELLTVANVHFYYASVPQALQHHSIYLFQIASTQVQLPLPQEPHACAPAACNHLPN